jgi:hypothetical protein
LFHILGYSIKEKNKIMLFKGKFKDKWNIGKMYHTHK